MIADASARPAAPGPRRAMNLARREERAFYLFILPWILGFLVFWAIPMLASIVLSFTRWNMDLCPECGIFCHCFLSDGLP